MPGQISRRRQSYQARQPEEKTGRSHIGIRPATKIMNWRGGGQVFAARLVPTEWELATLHAGRTRCERGSDRALHTAVATRSRNLDLSGVHGEVSWTAECLRSHHHCLNDVPAWPNSRLAEILQRDLVS